jgi:hypothetical protein
LKLVSRLEFGSGAVAMRYELIPILRKSDSLGIPKSPAK